MSPRKKVLPLLVAAFFAKNGLGSWPIKGTFALDVNMAFFAYPKLSPYPEGVSPVMSHFSPPACPPVGWDLRPYLLFVHGFQDAILFSAHE